MDFGRPLWVADSREGFRRGVLLDIAAATLTVQLENGGAAVAAAYEDVLPAEEEGGRHLEDNCSLRHLNEANLLHNCRLRFSEGLIYTYVGNVLLAVNPYQQLPWLYSSERMAEYRGRSLGQAPPHIYAIAEKARLDMRRSRDSQSIIVSGESGSGKTESQKAVLAFLCTTTVASPIQKRILETNPVLEAFGNAKTVRNHNSSRFGKFVEVHFDSEGRVGGGFISHYLLERNRVTGQSKGERNYHIFYQLIAGIDQELFQQLRLAPPSSFDYLSACPLFFGKSVSSRSSASSSPLSDSLLDDASQFQAVTASLEGAGLSPDSCRQIFSLLAAILHLGNIRFVEDASDNRGGCGVESSSVPSLAMAAQLLRLEETELKAALLTRIMQPTRGGIKGTLIRVALKCGEARAGRDALAKSIYSRLFDWIVSLMNSSIPSSATSSFIGVLDIAGFEFFARNSFEQFCINFCNEKLHNFFSERVLGEEQRLYEREAIPVPRVNYSDNADCIDLFEAKGVGLLDLLDEEAKLPRPSAHNFTLAAHSKHAKHFRLDKARTCKEYRHMRDEDGFLIRHYAGTVCYETSAFLEKNNDALHASLEILMESSEDSLIKQLFASKPDLKANIHRLRAVSVGSKFKSQLGILLQKLAKTGTHFVRCVKPNDKMAAGHLEGGLVLAQLRCAGVPALLRLMHVAYPSRVSFSHLYSLYASALPKDLARLEPRLFCKCLFRAIGLSQEDFAFGTSKVFFRSGKFAEFDKLLHGDPDHIASLVSATKSSLLRLRWRQSQYAAWASIKLQRKILVRREAAITIQRFSRGFAARRKHTQRIGLLSRAQRLQAALPRAASPPQLQLLHAALHSLIHSIREEKTSIEETVAEYEKCVAMVDEVLSKMREAEELRKQRELEEQRRRMEEEKEERILQQREQRRKQEEERKAEEEEEKKRREEDERERMQMEEREKEEEKERERRRLDATLREDRVEEDIGVTAPPQEVQHDLTTWKYAQLRDTINTSADVSLLMACKAEFHRRLRVYNDWKSRHNRSQQPAPIGSSPLRPLPSSSSRPLSSGPPPLNLAVAQHRFFKVPLAGAAGQNGLLYAHFDGQYIARQMEMRAGEKAAVLVAGRDSLRMMDVSLEQSGLTRRKGAEIKGQEFEAVWAHLGGQPQPQWKP